MFFSESESETFTFLIYICPFPIHDHHGTQLQLVTFTSSRGWEERSNGAPADPSLPRAPLIFSVHHPSPWCTSTPYMPTP